MQDKPGSPCSPGILAGTPKSPRRRRTAKMGRVDYATMDALADLNYAINRGVPDALSVQSLPHSFSLFVSKASGSCASGSEIQ